MYALLIKNKSTEFTVLTADRSRCSKLMIRHFQ
jgi:hypothetical protein